MLLTEHVTLSVAATGAAIGGRQAEFDAAAAALDDNSVAISQAVGSIYGPEVESDFLMLWRDHIAQLVTYTAAAAAGDTLLCVVADRLRACVGEQGLVARLGGDEFAILQDDADREEKGLALAERIIEIVSVPYLIDGFSATVGVSVGITFISDCASDADACLKRADQALYWAKQAGRGRAVIYEQEESLARLASFAGLSMKRLQA